jgi:ABC-type cobalamin transport system ATPase subunit
LDLLIADTFTDSLARLSGEEQKAVKTTAFDLQIDPSSPGLSFHKLDKAKDKRFWSVRVSSDTLRDLPAAVKDIREHMDVVMSSHDATSAVDATPLLAGP